MTYEVVVVGGGIGGLTTAALLAARGMNVCLFERARQVGGCIANFEYLDYRFEPTAGLYAGGEAGGAFERVFSELSINPPEVRRVSPAYVVRLPDGTDVVVAGNIEQLEQNLSLAFPECVDAALRFYRELAKIDQALSVAIARLPEFETASRLRQLLVLLPRVGVATRLLAGMNQPAVKYLAGTSSRFRSFVDAQLRIFAQGSSKDCSYAIAAATLMAPQRGLFAVSGGAEALANTLAEAITSCGGTVRLNTPVLRLAYGAGGDPTGVDLLSGETVIATRAIVSNLTIWDTYGKLVGLSRTTAKISAQLKQLCGVGAYLLFLAMDESTGSRLPADHVLALTGSLESEAVDSGQSQFMFAAAPRWDARAPKGMRAVTVCTPTDVGQWFAFHESEAEHDEQDQRALEERWARLHATMPELGGGVEVIETATPRTFYEMTRRKLGMVGGLYPNSDVFSHGAGYQTAYPNTFMVGDTVSAASGLGGVMRSARVVAKAVECLSRG
jgi:phytoene dehydrogenase-like protein